MKNRAEISRDKLLEIVREKHRMILGILEESGIDCWLIFIRETASNPDPVQRLVIGGDVVWESAFIFYIDNNGFEKIAIVGNFDADAEKNKNVWDRVLSYDNGISEQLKNEIEKIIPDKIGLNYSLSDVVSDGLSHGMYLKLENILEQYADKFVSAQEIVQKVRSRKTRTEIELIRKSAELTEEINNTLTKKTIRPGLTELEIQTKYHDMMDKLGVIESWQRNSCPAIDAGPDKVMGHVGPSDLKTKNGHTLHNDFGVILNGYASDIQRMWFFGSSEELPDELDHAFKTVHGAITASAEFIKPGVKGYEVDQVARNYVENHGYEEYKHALGHQVGTKAHDGGLILGPKWERYGDLPSGEVEENQIFTLELYVKTDNYGMVSLEEMIRITEIGCEFIVPRQNDWIYMSG